MSFISVDISNPESESISRKDQIDISLSTFEISASGYLGAIKTDYANVSQIVVIPDETIITGSLYYTPIYKEKLDYQTWLSRINKNFEELT